jgi:hypothetical protein
MSGIVWMCIGLAAFVTLLILVCVPKSESRIVKASKPVHLPKPKKYLDVSDLEEDDIDNLEWQRDFFRGKK